MGIRTNTRLKNNMLSAIYGQSDAAGHLRAGFACYSFVPNSAIPLKVIVLDDTQREDDGSVAMMPAAIRSVIALPQSTMP